MKKTRIGLATVVLSLGMAGVVSAEEVKPLSDPDNIYEGYGWHWPTSGTGFSTISGQYGERRAGERNPYHVGIDIAVNEKPVYAVADGEVVMSGKFSDGAQVIVIEHDDTAINGTPLYTRYLHLKLGSRLVDQYDSVSEGERIATSGNTGGVKAHLHFDINEDEDTSPEFNDSVEDTIDPAYFWPYMLDSFALAANGQGEGDEHDHDDHADYDDPDKYFDQILINYVGEKKFDKWFDALDESERTVTKLKSDFNISDDDVEKIFKEAKEKAKKKRK